jgi:hypothetical protein
MQSFEMASTSPSEFVHRIRAGLAERGFDRQVMVRLDGDQLIVEFRWMGTSSFEYSVVEGAGGFRADLIDRRVASLHAAFTDRFEHYFEKALDELGAKIV